MDSAEARIEQLGLAAHPEADGTARPGAASRGRTGARAGQRSCSCCARARLRTGTVDAAELWIWQAGDPVELRLAASGAGPVRSVILGSDVAAGHKLQGLVAPHEWQAARPHGGAKHGYSLVSCVVVPGFDFAGFTLAPPGWEPGR